MDGRKDFLLLTGASKTSWLVLHSLPAGGFEVIDTHIAHTSYWYSRIDGWPAANAFLADLNGDGTADLIECQMGWGQPAQWTVRYLSPGPGLPAFEATPESLPYLENVPCSGVQFVDIDADGKKDIIFPMTSTMGALSYVAPNEWTLMNTNLPITADPNCGTGSSVGTVLLFPDINGDGLPDAFIGSWSCSGWPSTIQSQAFINTGAGFSAQLRVRFESDHRHRHRGLERQRRRPWLRLE